jgi:hypothetical protein
VKNISSRLPIPAPLNASTLAPRTGGAGTSALAAHLAPAARSSSVNEFLAKYGPQYRDTIRSADVWRADANGAPDPQGEKLIFGFIFACRQARDEVCAHGTEREAKHARQVAQNVLATFVSAQYVIPDIQKEKPLNLKLNHCFTSRPRSSTAGTQERTIFANRLGVSLIEDKTEIVLTNPGYMPGPGNQNIALGIDSFVCSDEMRFPVHEIKDLRLIVREEDSILKSIDLNPGDEKLVNWLCVEMPVGNVGPSTPTHIIEAFHRVLGRERAKLYRTALIDKFGYAAISCLREHPVPGVDEASLASAQAIDPESYQRGKEYTEAFAAMGGTIPKPGPVLALTEH